MQRREFLAGSLAMPVALAAQESKVARKGRLKQGVCGGVFGRGMAFEDACRHAARLGAQCFDLRRPEEFPVMKKYGIVPTIVAGAMSLTGGCNRVEDHPEVEKKMHTLIDQTAAAGGVSVIALSGNRRGMSDEEGQDNCVTFLNKVKAHAEDKGITICMELLNSKVNHPDYQCDRTKWGVEMCKRVNSPRVKLLYDIYHMQIMEGDIIRTIRENISYFGHFHTAGNPGRNEFDLDTQELNYRGICKAIVDLGYQGYISHEYGPKHGEPLKVLDEMLTICDV
ncbi:MAG: TIM barrel protein [Bryobacteraceae bacterium]|nr:TIM barrel protein [Bryobacteraceae bacterium]